jgi:hypothetical protein
MNSIPKISAGFNVRRVGKAQARALDKLDDGAISQRSVSWTFLNSLPHEVHPHLSRGRSRHHWRGVFLEPKNIPQWRRSNIRT